MVLSDGIAKHFAHRRIGPDDRSIGNLDEEMKYAEKIVYEKSNFGILVHGKCFSDFSLSLSFSFVSPSFHLSRKCLKKQ